MILNDIKLREIGPALLQPFDPKLVNPASIDTRIGYSMKVESREGGWVDVDLRDYLEEKPYMLAPGQFVLVGSLEVFNIPTNCVGEWRIKSSRAREGYNNVLAVHLDPGWNGSVLTMEIKNEREHAALPLYPGLRIGMVILHECEVPEASYAVTGRYNNDSAVMGSKG